MFFYSLALAQTGCVNPPVPFGYALPCPTFSLASYSVLQSGTLTGTITPTAGVTQYIYTTGYVYNGSSWLPETIVGSSPYAGYSNTVSTLTLNSSILSTLPVGTIYTVEWDWTWNAANNCYRGPGSTVCNQGNWRLQEFTLGSSVSPTPSTPLTPPGCSNGGCNNYYVTPAGSGTACTQLRLCSLSYALSAFALGSNGAVIHLTNGSYGTTPYVVTRGGSSSSVRLYIQCDAGMASAWSAAGVCMFQGSLSIAANNVDVIGLDIGNNSNLAFAIDGVCGTSPSTACATGNSVHIIGNYVHDLAGNVANPSTRTVGCPLNGAIQIGSDQHGRTATDPEALRNIVVRYGKRSNVSCNDAQGIYAGNGGAIVENNIIGDIPAGGINPTAGCGNVISNNTIFNVKTGISLGDQDNSTCPGGVSGYNTIENNYIANVDSYSIFYVGGGAECTVNTPNLFSHNISDGSGIAEFSSGTSACDAIVPNLWIHQAPTSFFVRYQTDGSGDYHLASGSSGIDAGATTCVSGGTAPSSPCVPSTDFDSFARPYGTAYDVGAYEWHP